MIHLASWLAASLAVLPISNAVPQSIRSMQQDFVLPSNDSFYAVPDGVDDFEPGAILRFRTPPSPLAAFGIVADNLQHTYQVLYRTTDSIGKPTATVLTVMVPYNADYSKIISYQVAEDAATIDCAPSYTLQLQSENSPYLQSKTTQLQLLLMETCLAQGWVVIVPDFQGPGGAFGASKIAGYAILDGIRAALNSCSFTGIEKKSQIAMWGYSGGGSVTQAAAALQSRYAPELDISGAAIGGVSDGDISKLWGLNNGPRSELLVIAMLGLASQYSELSSLIHQNLKPEYRDTFYTALHQCLEGNIITFFNRDIIDMFKNGSFPSIYLAISKAFHEELEAVTSTPQIPLFWYQSVQDEIASIQNLDSEVAKYCADGASVQFQRDNASNLNHRNYGLIGAPQALSWLKEIMSGRAVEPGCVNNTITTSKIDQEFLALFPKEISDILVTLAAGG